MLRATSSAPRRESLSASCVVVVLLLFAGVAHAEPKTPQLALRVSFNELANLTYQLDCLSGRTNCHAADYQALWNRELLTSDEDRKMLAAWGAIRARYGKRYDVDTKTTFAIEPAATQVSVATSIAIAGLQASDLADYLSRLDLLVMPRDRGAFEAVVRHFEPRFATWWKREAVRPGTAWMKKAQTFLDSASVRAQIASLVGFYEPDLPPGFAMTFDLLIRPGFVNDGASGQQRDGRMLVEFFPTEDLHRRADVLLHELCHFLYGIRSLDKQAAFQQRLLATKRPSALPAFHLLDEGLASAFGNGVVHRAFAPADTWNAYLARDRSFYNDANIDRAGKALLPVVDEWLAAGKTMSDPTFIARYLDALDAAFGGRLASPALRLGETYLYVDDGLPADELQTYVKNAFHTYSLYAEYNSPLDHAMLDPFTSRLTMSGVLVVTHHSLDSLVGRNLVTADELRAIKQASAKGLLYAKDRGPFATTYIIVADSPDVAKRLLDQLAAAPALFTGAAPRR